MSTSTPSTKDIYITIPYNRDVYDLIDTIIQRDPEQRDNLELFQQGLLAKSIRYYYLS